MQNARSRDSVTSGFHRDVVLSDGVRVPVREVRPKDAPALQRLVGRLSPDSVYMRYFGYMKALTQEKARRFAEVDGYDRFALVALDPGDPDEIVAVARYDREGNSPRAEYAVVVEDRLQGQGLGLALTRELVEAARKRDVRELYALVLHENTGMLKLLRRLDLPEDAHWEDGVEYVTMHLEPERGNRAS